MNKLSIADLLENSASYDRLHTITQADADKATDLHHRITSALTTDKPMPGDIMICKGPEKEYINGHIAYENLSLHAAVCTEPYVPFVFIDEDSNKPSSMNTSGGYWFRIPKEKLSNVKYVGQRYKLFKAIGHCGLCHAGAFTFSCRVNVWEYYSDDIY